MILLLTACFTLDPLVHNNKHCSTTGPDEPSCVDANNEWDAACLACEDDYVWNKDYPYFEGQLEGLEVLAPDPDALTIEGLETEDGEGVLETVFVPGHGDNADITILMNHGNYVGIEHYIPHVRYFHTGGYSVLIWDYRGYGKSEPSSAPTGSQWMSDARQVRDYADTIAPDPDRIVLFAVSLGGIPAVEMGVYDPGCAMILQAPFTSIESVSAENNGVALPGQFLTEGHFENHLKIQDYDAPLFVMIGTEDVKFSVESVTELHDNAGTPDAQKKLWVVEGVGHGISDVGIAEWSTNRWLEEIDSFLDNEGSACRP